MILAMFVLTILTATDLAEGSPRNILVTDSHSTGAVPTFWSDIAAKGNEKGWDVLESVSEIGILDRHAKSLVLMLGRIVAIRSLTSLLSVNGHESLDEVCCGVCMVRDTKIS
jgi:hypothetical protein